MVSARACLLVLIAATYTAALQWQASPPPDVGKSKARPKVVYGVFTSQLPQYRKKLEAVMDTWALTPMNEGRFVAIAGRTYPAEFQRGDSVVKADCDDGPPSLSCKEANLLVEGSKRGADWLFISGEDNYVDTQALEKHLSNYQPDDNVALGCLGCGYGHFCEAVKHRGGFCGGCGYAISRGALARLTENGTEALISEYGGHERQQMPNDMSTSCALYQRGAKLQFLGNLEASPTFGIKEFERSHKDTHVFHYVTPEVMRWIHGLKTGIPAEQIALLEANAFDGGCAIGMDNTFWHDDYVQCLEEHRDRKHL